MHEGDSARPEPRFTIDAELGRHDADVTVLSRLRVGR